MSVLDVGCGIDGRSFSDHVNPSWRITGVDVEPAERIRHANPNFRFVPASVGALPFQDKAFDLLVSFGMLEHIISPTYEAACREMQRVARQYAILVPYKWAWIEPHYKFPFFGALPHNVQRGLILALNLQGHKHRLDYFENNFRWRSNAEYLAAFPGSRIAFMPTLETICIIRSP